MTSENMQLIEEARAFADRDNGLNWQGRIRELADALEAAEKAHIPADEHAPVARRINFSPSTITLDLETGNWIEPKPAITGAQGARVAASVLPGVSEEQVARWYDQFMSGAEPQGEPSDAQLLAQGFRDGVDYIDDQPGPWGAAVVAGRAEAARRVAAAGGTR